MKHLNLAWKTLAFSTSMIWKLLVQTILSLKYIVKFQLDTLSRWVFAQFLAMLDFFNNKV